MKLAILEDHRYVAECFKTFLLTHNDIEEVDLYFTIRDFIEDKIDYDLVLLDIGYSRAKLIIFN